MCLFESFCALSLINHGPHQEYHQEMYRWLSATHPPQDLKSATLWRGHQKMKALSATRGALSVGGGDLEKRNGQHEALTATRAATSEDLEIRSAHNEYCILCRDGAVHYEDNTLFMLCLQLPPDIETKVLQEDISFRCICCHIKMEQSAAYFGFYNSNGLPFLDKFLSVTGALEVSARAKISVALVIFIYLILVDFEVAAYSLFLVPGVSVILTTVPQFEYQLISEIRDSTWERGTAYELRPKSFRSDPPRVQPYIKPYYSGDGIKYVEVYYDIGLKNSFIWERVVIGVSTHTDEDFGDPFTGYGDDSKGHVSTLVNDQSIIDHAQESYLWMLCCSSLINNLDSFHGLQEAVVR
ncbi:uncharacterized protein F5147DRAFT_651353 [Suillus discolor]|uniref:Uncharacterized protein n=1 Tax=Suillus discolor TaxID=1912936 RepID=A0A9P7FBT7_9AGAM|nr:uncharacterized protein F5147DRAFT_651353 [Suillus discolor]KAG2111726.1 hypothetical protein F5147DRAFT_651353 [Suillus discolor]